MIEDRQCADVRNSPSVKYRSGQLYYVPLIVRSADTVKYKST